MLYFTMVKFYLLFLSLATVSFAAYTTKSKKGKCPINAGEVGICSDCSSDYDCPGSKKCCSSSIGRCARYCVVPVFGVVGSIGSSSRRISTIDGIGGSGIDTTHVVSSRRVLNAGGGGKDILHAGIVGGTDSIIGGGSRRVVETVDVGGLSGVGGKFGKRVTHVSGVAGVGDVDGMIDGGAGLIGGTRRIVETVNVGGRSGTIGTGHLLGGTEGISDKAILKSVGGMVGGRRGGVVDVITGRSGSGVIRGVDARDAISGRTAGIIGRTSVVIGGGCTRLCNSNEDCGAKKYCVSLSDGCSRVCRSGRALKNDY